MFKITAVQSPTEQAQICRAVGAPLREGCFCYKMFDMESGELMGMSQFDVSESGRIYDLRDAGQSDYEAMFILGRQTMNVIESWGITDCYAESDAGDGRLLHAIGFRDRDGALFCDLTGMFDGNCGNH